MGEFALRDGPWKIVYRMAGKNVEASRGQSTIAELYDLEHDIAEANNLAAQHPDIVATLTAKLDAMINRGATRQNISAHNDSAVNFRRTQTERWAPAAATDAITTAPEGFTRSSMARPGPTGIIPRISMACGKSPMASSACAPMNHHV
jgi:hypothetical protein